ncbi:hypothetical protein JCM33374_g2561 [Metschnikowia sp. JCM 33374]|nr:hypothetical protein JCM33374_g2561 [Metschnikowia sp. JCM 33374]
MKYNHASKRWQHLAKICALFVAVKIAHFVIIVSTPAQFDVSTSILLRSYLKEKEALASFHTAIPMLNRALGKITSIVVERFLDRLVTWDAVYFADLFVNGIQYEHQFVFCPLWWRLVRILPVNPETEFYSRLFWATFITNMCHLGSALVLYFYTVEVFGKARIFSPERMAVAASMLYVCSPAAAFLTAPYSESIAALCSFLCLFLREISVGQTQLTVGQDGFIPGTDLPPRSLPKDVPGFSLAEKPETTSKQFQSRPQSRPQSHPQSASLYLHVSSLLKSSNTGIYMLSGAFAALAFGFRANCLFLGIIYIYDLCLSRTKSPVLPLAAGSLLGVAFLAIHVHSYVYVCDSGRGEWCESRLPSLFAYAQSHYWGNGFLKYWTMNNLPNFAFAAPTVVLSALAVRYFAQIYPVERILPVLAVNVVFLLSLILFWHVQIITRIHTFLPVVYWLMAGLITQPNTSDRKWAKAYVAYFVIWNVLQPSLFSAFLPPA